MRIEKPEQKVLETLEVKESFRVKTKDGNYILDEGDILQIVEANGLELTEDVQVPTDSKEVTILEAGDFINVKEAKKKSEDDEEDDEDEEAGSDKDDADDDDDDDEENKEEKKKKESVRSRRRRMKESHISGAIQDEVVTSLIEAMVDRGGMYAASELQSIFSELISEYYDMMGSYDSLYEFFDSLEDEVQRTRQKVSKMV